MKLKKVYGVISLLITIGVLFSTIYLGQHFILDLVAGAAVAGACIFLAGRISNKELGRGRLASAMSSGPSLVEKTHNSQ